ncbi:MAG: cell division cycle- protein [Peltula sp. TS41687]|nr:MAG: cell division cycle- protein [Peltula sp. TS41687]
MERSSPLAAMQPPCLLGPWGLHPEPHSLAHPQVSDRGSFGPNSFNFKDLSMKRSASDYFMLKPVRGSSPTASLAADLSQNFHIDKSPQVATPRRSLFSSTLFGTLSGRESVTTPPLPSSSPGPCMDAMDISPLPHKAPFSIVTQIEVHSPTALMSPDDHSVSSGSGNFLGPATDHLKENSAFERRKPPFPRPSLARTKGYSTNTVSLKTNRPETQLPSFKFGGGSTKPVGECFMESPPKERKMSLHNPMNLMGFQRPKQSFAAMVNNVRTGLPMNGHVRKSSIPAPRPRKFFRRSLSMFEHPDDIMKEAQPFAGPPSELQAVMDVDEPHVLALPHFVPEHQPDSLPRITKETLIDVLDGRYVRSYDQFLIVDCRFEYEYEGGHIEGAINYTDKDLLASKLFESLGNARTLLIFHCEYSAHRAPMMAKFIRGQDRTINDFRYPELTYPEVYILDGGYSSFFGQHRSRCFPPHYVEMDSKDHAGTCEREMGKLRHRKKLSRAQTYAFESPTQHVEESPSAAGRFNNNDTMMTSTLPDEQIRAHARRMASY